MTARHEAETTTEMFLTVMIPRKHFESDVSSGMCHGEVFHANAHHFLHGRRRGKKTAREDLLAGFSEVFREEGIKNGVDTWVSIGQAVRDDAKRKRSIIQWEQAEFYPHSDNVVRHPADEERSDNQQHRLSCLENTGRERKTGWLIIPQMTWFLNFFFSCIHKQSTFLK